MRPHVTLRVRIRIVRRDRNRGEEMTEDKPREGDARKLSESDRPRPVESREPAPTGVQSAASAWEDLGLERSVAPPTPVRKERLFSRKVLIGWALLTLAAYFGLRLVTTVVKDSVREAVAARSVPGKQGTIVIVLPNGEKITINRNGNARGPIPEIVIPKPPEPRPPQIPPPVEATPAPTTKR